MADPLTMPMSIRLSRVTRRRTHASSFRLVSAASLVAALAGVLGVPAYAQTGIGGHAALPTPSPSPKAAATPAPGTALATEYQGMAPFRMAITNDGRYAFVTFFLSEVVLKVRLADMTVEAKADLSHTSR